jgi:CheY-like chemotaxis protein
MLPAKFSDHDPRPERRPPAPITNLPVNALTSDPDPTLEIRTLIEQLQHAAREARGHAREAEQERDDLGSQLERALVQIDELRANERELRSQFTEVTTILRERDQAIAAADRAARTAARAQEENAALLKQREEALRQRDEALRRFEGVNRAHADSAQRSADVQKQLAAIRLARDSAHAQNLELSDRVSALEDELAELGYQRDAVKKAQKQAEAEAAEYRRQVETGAAQQEAATRRIEELTGELDEQRRKLLDLAEQKTAVLQAGNEHAVALAEARAQVASLVQERDAARLLEQAQGRELEKIRAQFQSFREHDAQAANDELASAREKLAAFEAQARQARHDAADLRQQMIAMQEKTSTLEVLAEEAIARQEEAEVQLLAGTQQFETDRAALQLAQQQLEKLTNERHSIRAKAEETRLELEAQLIALRAQAQDAPAFPTPAADGSIDLRELQRRFEKQRLETIDLAARFESAQRQIREMSASLAEARLQVKFATSAARQNTPLAKAQDLVPAPKNPPALPLTDLLAPMREGFAAYAQNPGDVSLLLEFHDRIVTYAERARLAHCVALYRLAHVFAGLLESLAEAPGRVNPSTLHTIEQTIEFFVALRDDAAPDRFRDPAQARVLVVDDDPDNCHCVQMVMQEQMIQATASQDPSSALLELASEDFDLIFLDVNMPHMNGFELCQRLRGLPLHAKTPVVFLTGLATDEIRTQSSLSGGDDFLGKPFNLHELTVKALTLILQAQVEEA